MNDENSKKIRGTVIAGVVVILYYLLMLGMIFYFQFSLSDKMPWIFFIVINLLLLVFVVAIIMALISRIKEIKGGEEDEASKY